MGWVSKARRVVPTPTVARCIPQGLPPSILPKAWDFCKFQQDEPQSVKPMTEDHVPNQKVHSKHFNANDPKPWAAFARFNFYRELQKPYCIMLVKFSVMLSKWKVLGDRNQHEMLKNVWKHVGLMPSLQTTCGFSLQNTPLTSSTKATLAPPDWRIAREGDQSSSGATFYDRCLK